MLFQRHNLSLPTVSSEGSSQHANPCLMAGNEPGGQAKPARFGRLAARSRWMLAARLVHFASICRYGVYSLPGAAALLVTFCALFCASASAQTAHFVSAMSALPITTQSNFVGTAVDASGNIYIADPLDNQVLKETLQSDGSYTEGVVANAATNGLNMPEGVAADPAGNVYIADTNNSRVLKEALSAGGYSQTVVADSTTLIDPQAVAVDAYGNVVISDTGHNRVLLETYTGTGYNESTVASNLSFVTGVAVDAYDDVAIADSGNNQVLVEALSSGTYSLYQTFDSGLNPPLGVAIDGNLNIYIADSGNNRVLEEVYSGSAFISQNVIAAISLNGPRGLAVDSSGNVYIADTNDERIVKESQTSGNFGTVAVGTNNSAISLLFEIDTAGTFGAPVVVTQGATGLDFANAGTATGSCTAGSHSAGALCTVVVTFTPKFPGSRFGAVDLTASGSTVATGYLQGYGTGAQVNFLPPIQSVPITGVVPSGIAVDSVGNMYATDGTVGQLVVIAPGQAAAQSTVIVQGMTKAAGVAVDGNGNVYVADAGANVVVKAALQAGGGYVKGVIPTSALNTPAAVAVDGNGNVYIADVFNKRVLKETLSTGSYFESTVADASSNGLSEPVGVAVDGSGNVYIATIGNKSQVLKETPSLNGSYTQTVVPAPTSPSGIAVDGNGNLFIDHEDTSSPIVKETPYKGGYTSSIVSTTGLMDTIALAVDPHGNVYVASEYNGGSVVEENFSVAPTLSFSSTDEGKTTDISQTVTVENTGNTPLTFGAVNFPLDFPEPNGVGADCKMGMSLYPSVTCTLTIDFSPIAPLNGNSGASLSESVILQENIFNPAGGETTQSVTVTGTETAPPPPPTITLSPATLPGGMVGVAYSQQFTASGGAAPYTYTVTGGIMPAGLTLSSGGLLSGTPTASGPFSIGVTATDSSPAPGPYSGSASFSLTIGVTPVAATPTFSVATGVYTSAQTVAISDSTSGAAMYYTIDGSTPTTSSIPYGSPITVGSSEIVQAIAVATGFSNSAIASAGYVINLPGTAVAATPTFSAPTGIYTSSQSVTLTDTTSGAAIYYTTDGSTPTAGSTLYSSAITVSATEVIQAIAVATGYNNSEVASAAYALNLSGTPVAATPAFSVATGVYSSAQTVTLTDSTSGSAIYYTTDGTTPTTSSAKYVNPIAASTSETIQAIAVATGYSNSAIASAAYAINLPGNPVAATPTFSVAAGTYTSAQTVTLADTTTGAAIYYTTNGSTPTTSSTKYSGAITVSSTEVVEAIAVVSGYNSSATAVAGYIINLPGNPVAATPTFSVASGSYTTVQTVRITDTTTGATIYYTSDGSTPTVNSNLADGPITVSSTETLQAIAVASGYTNSAIAAAAYAINLPGTPVAATPAFSVASGNYTSAQTVTLSDTTTGATIYYTTDGSTPTVSSNLADGPITVSSTETIQAIAVASGYSNSAVAAAAYNISQSQAQVAAPHFSIGTGTYATAQTVTLTDATAGATIYYTTDGSTPTAGSNLADGSITVSSTVTLKAVAIAAGDTNSEVVWAAYTINPAAPDFTISASNTSATMLQGSPAVFNLAVAPLNTTTFSSGLTLTATGLPTGATAAFSPASIASGAGTTPITMTIQAPTASASTQHSRSIVGKLAPFSLALLLLPFASRLRKSGKRLGRMLMALLLLAASAATVAGLSGCGSTNGIFGLMPKAYTVTVTGTMGSVSHSTTIILIVQ